MALKHLSEEDLDEYLTQYKGKEDSDLTNKQLKRRDDILRAAMVIRAFGAKTTKKMDNKIAKIVLR